VELAMIRGALRALVVAGLAAVLVGVLRDPHAMLAPGPMVAGHERIGADCFACHAPGRGVAAARCAACHPPARIGLVTTAGQPITRETRTLIGSFHTRIRERDCLACHTDHVGPAGGRAGRRFTHDMLEPVAREACASCHRAPADPLHGEVAGACATCHSNDRWSPATFAHEKYFLLDRNHTAPCATCHPGGAFERYTCYGCHEHSEAGIRGKHVEEGIRDLADCVHCHRSAAEHEGGERGDRRGEGGGDD
jgi:hypothetical protein